MKEKKAITVNLSTSICIIIIILLVIILGIVFYFGFINNKENQDLENEKEELENQIQILENSKEESDKNEKIMSSEEIKNILEKEDTSFCIENIEEDEQGYIITANLLEKDAREISKKEYEDLVAGKEIKFRNLTWKFDSYLYNNKDISIKSGNDKLSIIYDEEKEIGLIENIAGAKIGGLCDYANQLIKFNVDKNILIGTLFEEFRYDENGELKMYDMEGKEIQENKNSVNDLLKWSDEKSGSYEECIAFVKDGKIDGIQMFKD